MVAALCGFPTRPRLPPHAGPAPRRRHPRIRTPAARRHLLFAPLRIPPQPPRASARLRHRRCLRAACCRGCERRAACVPGGPPDQPGRPDPFWPQGTRDRHRLLTETEPVPAETATDMLAWEHSGFSIDASVRIALIDCDVPSYFRSLEHLLRGTRVTGTAPEAAATRIARRKRPARTTPSRRRCRPPVARPPSGASSCRCMTTGQSFRDG